MSQLEEQAAVETASGLVIDVLEAGVLAQPGGPGPAFEPLLTPHADLLIEQQPQPLGMVERASFGLGIEALEAFGHAGQAEFVEKI